MSSFFRPSCFMLSSFFMSSCFIWSWAKAVMEVVRAHASIRLLKSFFIMSPRMSFDLRRQAGFLPASKHGMSDSGGSYIGKLVVDCEFPQRLKPNVIVRSYGTTEVALPALSWTRH